MRKLSVLLLPILLLAACSNESQPVAGTSKASSGSSSQFQQGTAVTQKDFMKEGVSLSVTPNPYSSCDFPNDKAVVTVGYDAKPAGIKHVQIWVQSRNGRQVLWGQSPGTSPPTPTGKWMGEGSKFLLVDLDTANLIAVTTVHAAPCH